VADAIEEVFETKGLEYWKTKRKSVIKVKAGKYSQPEITFTINSPARAGLVVGRRCTIEATWTGQEYVVDETHPMDMSVRPSKRRTQ
jgi:hypothetical protein